MSYSKEIQFNSIVDSFWALDENMQVAEHEIHFHLNFLDKVAFPRQNL